MSYNLNDLQSDINHAYHLSDMVVEVSNDGPPDGERFERLCSLAWVLRDILDKARSDIEQHFRTIGTTCKDWQAVAEAEKGAEA